MERLGVGALIERDQVSVGVKDGELLGSPWLGYEWCIGMNYGVTGALSVEVFDSSDLHSTTGDLRNAPIFAGPEVDFDWAIGNDAVLALDYMHFGEAKLGREELGTSLDIKRCEDGRCGNEVTLCVHGWSIIGGSFDA